MDANAPLYEPAIIENIYVNDLGAIEDAGDGNVRFTFCLRREVGGCVEREVKVHLIAGPTMIMTTIRATLQHLGHRCCGAVLELVH